jgi:aspartyl-tRNA synthetase
VMAFEERWLEHVFEVVVAEHGKAIRETFGTEVVVPSLPFPRLSLAEAKELLREHGHEPVPGPDDDLDPASERALSQIVMRERGHEFVFLIDYPTSVRPFYHMRHPDRPGLTRSFDLLWRGIEITTGAQREHRHDVLLTQAREQGVEVEGIGYYLDFFRYGAPPHGGFGFGLTRLLMQMLGQDNVREVTFLYRGPHRLEP